MFLNSLFSKPKLYDMIIRCLNAIEQLFVFKIFQLQFYLGNKRRSQTLRSSSRAWRHKMKPSTLLNRFLIPPHSSLFLLLTIGQYYNLFTAVITPLAACFFMILTELHQWWRNYGCKKFCIIGYSLIKLTKHIFM